jgi:CRP-like cAMP-binding protein
MSAMQHFRAGDIISPDGDSSKSFFVLISGKVGIFKNDKRVGFFNQAGQIFGEMSLILNEPRDGEIRALESSSVLEVKGDLDEIIKLYPDISKKIIKTLADKLAHPSDKSGKKKNEDLY